MSFVIVLGLYASTLLMLWRPRATFVCASAFFAVCACVELSRDSIGAAAVPLVCAALFAWLTLSTRDALGSQPEVRR